MKTSQLKNWSILFYIAAFYNLSAAIPALLNYSLHIQTFFKHSVVPDEFLAFFYHLGFWFSVLIFGIGYWIVAREPSKNHGILLLAIIGKTGVGIGFFWTYWLGLGTVLLALGGIGDILFAGSFCYYLYLYNSKNNA